MWCLFVLFLFYSFPLNLDAHGDVETHSHEKSEGGALLNGYPWGLFSGLIQFDKRVEHRRNQVELNLANKIFTHIAHGYDVSFPLSLEHQSYKPFGDGQSNGRAFFSYWPHEEAPLFALLDRERSELTIELHPSLASTVENSQIDILFPVGETVRLDVVASTLRIEVDIASLGWDTLNQGKILYVKPSHWTDFFAIKFQKTNYSIEEILAKVPSDLKPFSLPNPLGATRETSTPELIQLMQESVKQGSNYLVFANDKVHSVYPHPDSNEISHKSSGGNWTFLLTPSLWEGPLHSTFKQLYSCFSGRALWEESTRMSVSGTAWHHVGDFGEFLLNSINGETRSLVTAVGDSVNPSEGVELAYGMNHVGYASLTHPGNVFVSVQGQFHWHPIHTTEPICLEVWTPLCKPDDLNNFGFSCP